MYYYITIPVRYFHIKGNPSFGTCSLTQVIEASSMTGNDRIYRTKSIYSNFVIEYNQLKDYEEGNEARQKMSL